VDADAFILRHAASKRHERTGRGVTAETQSPVPTVAESRRKLIVDGLGISVSAAGFALIYGLSCRAAGFSVVETAAMSVLVFAGAAQFAAVGYVVAGFPWLGIAALTGFLNARHFLYSASLAPYVAEQPRWLRAAMAHLLTDEAYALTIAHFRRLGRVDLWGYWWAGIVVTFIPWNLATIAGVIIGGSIPDPAQFGLDIFFPAAMAGFAVSLATGRREVVAALVGAVVGVAIGLAIDPAAGIVAGGVIGPLVAMLVIRKPPEEGEDAQVSALAFETTPGRVTRARQ
jgi:4-azaleucine resistance transporter AzlC